MTTDTREDAIEEKAGDLNAEEIDGSTSIILKPEEYDALLEEWAAPMSVGEGVKKVALQKNGRVQYRGEIGWDYDHDWAGSREEAESSWENLIEEVEEVRG